MSIRDIFSKVLEKKSKNEPLTEQDINIDSESRTISEITKKSVDSIIKTINAKTHKLEEFNQFKKLFDNRKYDESFEYVMGSVNVIGNLLADDKYINDYTKEIYDDFMSCNDTSERMFKQFETFIKGNKKFSSKLLVEIDNVYNIYKYYRENTQRDH